MANSDPVRQERTGWRDLALNELHRGWGYDVPMVDIDFLAVEYNHRRAYAVIDYKHERAYDLGLRSANASALADLATRAGVPALIVRYWPPPVGSNDWVFQTFPLNDAARAFAKAGYLLSERGYVRMLNTMRDGIVDEAHLETLSDGGVVEVSRRLSVAPKYEAAS